MRLSLHLLLSMGLLGAPAAAQLPQAEVEPGPGIPRVAAPIPEEPVAIGDWRIPIHTAADDPRGGSYGIWASGPDYKVSFHDGMAFYPVLGPGYAENLPLVWRTESIVAGGAPLVSAGTRAETSHSDWRFELGYPGVTEIYDVLPEGVEQSFVLHRAPPKAGDVVVTGRIETSLRAEPVAATHGELIFQDALGHSILSYGAAFAFDATGRSTEVATRFDGERICLTLEGAWLAGASYPVTIDPLTSSVVIGTYSAGTAGDPAHTDVARDDESDQVLVAYTRYVSASDRDAWGRLLDDDLNRLALVFTDISSSWDTYMARTAFVGGANRWVIAIQRILSTNDSVVRAYLHDKGDTGLNSGMLVHLPTSSGGVQHTVPDVGGVAGNYSGVNALVVFQVDTATTMTNTDYSDVYGVLLNASTRSFGTPFRLTANASGTTYDRDWPSVSQVSDGGTSSWVVAYQQFVNTTPNDDWDALITRVDHNGSVAGTDYVGPSGASIHKLRPKVEGRGERFLASYTIADNTRKTSSGFGREVRVQRFDWSETAFLPTKLPEQTLASSSGNIFWNGWGIGFDSNTDSHWVVAYHTNTSWNVYVDRVGYSGGLLEHATAYAEASRGYSAAVTFNDDDDEYVIVWGSTDSQHAVHGRRMQYYSSAQNTLYGTGCQGSIYADPPYQGSEFFTVYLRNGVPTSATALMLGFGSSSIPLGGGCFLNLDPLRPILYLGTGRSNTSGNLQFTVPLPDERYMYGAVYTQWVQLHPSSGALVSTRGLRSYIR